MLVVEPRLVGEERRSESDGQEKGELLGGLKAVTSLLIFQLGTVKRVFQAKVSQIASRAAPELHFPQGWLHGGGLG